MGARRQATGRRGPRSIPRHARRPCGVHRSQTNTKASRSAGRSPAETSCGHDAHRVVDGRRVPCARPRQSSRRRAHIHRRPRPRGACPASAEDRPGLARRQGLDLGRAPGIGDHRTNPGRRRPSASGSSTRHSDGLRRERGSTFLGDHYGRGGTAREQLAGSSPWR